MSAQMKRQQTQGPTAGEGLYDLLILNVGTVTNTAQFFVLRQVKPDASPATRETQPAR